MEIDLREIQQGDRLASVLAGFEELDQGEVLTLLSEEDPSGLEEDLRRILGERADSQRMRLGNKELPWVLHLKRSLAPSSYRPEEES